MDSEEDTGGVFMGTLSYPELEATIRLLLKKYHAEYALLFGSYARGEATPNSDIDLVVVGGTGHLCSGRRAAPADAEGRRRL